MWRPNIGSDVLMHSRGPWKKHKYIKVVDGQYIYPESMGAEMRRRHTQETEARIDNYERLEAEKAERDEAARERKVNAVNTTRASQRRGMERTERINAANKEEARRNKRNAINSAQASQNRGYDQTARVRQQRAEKLRQERNAEGRSAASKQINAKKNLRTENINAGNLARARQKAKNARLREERNAEGKSAVNRQLRNAEGRAAARKQISRANTVAAGNRAERNMEGRQAARKQIKRANTVAAGNRAERNIEGRQAVKRQITEGNQKMTARRVYEKGRRLSTAVNKGQSDGSWKMEDPRTRNKAKGKRPARLDVAAKQTLNSISREAYRTGYKAKKAATSAAKSISAKAQAAWNNSASYREQFADYKSFLNWYKKNRK